jgi:hypothetical protein
VRTTRRRDQGTVNSATRRLVDVLRPAHVEPAVVTGLRAALSLSVPFAIGVIVDDVERWSLVANGAFLVALCNVGGAYAIRAWVTLIAVVAVPLTAASTPGGRSRTPTRAARSCTDPAPRSLARVASARQ